MAPSLVLLVSLAWLVAPSTAAAGGCTSCSSAADCTADFGADALCVHFTSATGCGTTLQYCCPGQGCAIQPGMHASCESSATNPCTIVSGPPDAGPTGRIDGGGIMHPYSSGCSCRAVAGTFSTSSLALTLFALVGVRRRK